MKEFKLPKHFAEKWIKALRSGKYHQTTEILGKVKGDKCEYCCLGVAASLQGFEMDVLSENGELIELTKWDDNSDEIEYFDLIEAGLPDTLFTGELPSLLIEMNDRQNKTFDEIADWVEENVEFI